MVRNEEGFSLIEILTVVVIIGILSGFVIPRIGVARHQAYKDSVLNSLRNLRESEEIYFYQHGAYTDDQEAADLQFTIDTGVSITILQIDDYSYVATAEHLASEGSVCAIAVGKIIPSGYVAGRPECVDS